MFKQYRLAFVAAVICLSIILLSSETDAQPTVGLDETASCSSSAAEEVASVVKTIALNQKDVKALLSSEFQEVKNLLASNPSNPSNAVEPCKQTLVSALVSKCVPLLIQQNVDGFTFFPRSWRRSWEEYKIGFNDTRGYYWLGNELLSQLTQTGRYKLRFDLQSRNTSHWYYAEYTTFVVLNETTNYTLQVDGYSGNAGWDSFRVQNGMMFTTYDRDNDPWTGPVWKDNCAVFNRGGFWHNRACALYCSVNSVRTSKQGIRWYRLPGGSLLQSSRMWLQCK